MSEQSELWQDIPGYEGLYQVSNLGRVKSLERDVLRSPAGRASYMRREPERLLKPSIHASCKDYLYVRLYRNGNWKNHLVHCLVLLSFVGPAPVGMEACHFPDRNKRNNSLSNLRWDTRSANSEDRKAHGTRNGWRLSAETRAKMSASRTGVRRQIKNEVLA